jgi:hypothetical protein
METSCQYSNLELYVKMQVDMFVCGSESVQAPLLQPNFQIAFSAVGHLVEAPSISGASSSGRNKSLGLALNLILLTCPLAHDLLFKALTW